MPRPPLPRRVCCQLNGLGFRPIGAAAAKADALRIGVDELEAIRLADIEGLYQDAAAERMGVSRRHGRACHCAEGDADALVPYAGCRHGTT